MKSCFEFFGHGRDMSFSFSIACAYFCAPQLRCIPCRGGQKRVSLLLIIVKGKGLKKITPHRWATKSFGIIFLFTLLCIIALCLSSKISSWHFHQHQLPHFPRVRYLRLQLFRSNLLGPPYLLGCLCLCLN